MLLTTSGDRTLFASRVALSTIVVSMVALAAPEIAPVGAQETRIPIASPAAPLALETPAAGALSQVEHLRVKAFRFEGNTAFSGAELARVVAPFLNRDISAEDLEEARRQITLHYVNNGFINSGALLKDQPVGNGIVTFSIVQGALQSIEVSGNRHYRSGFLQREIRQAARAPFNVARVRNALELLRQNVNISRINADVQPGNRPGQALLRVEVAENDPLGLSIVFDNHRPASIGAERFSLVANHSNLTGRDDLLDLRVGLTQGGLSHGSFSGLNDLSLSYQSPFFRLPLFGARTNLLLHAAKNDAAVIEEPFRTLDISSRFENTSIGLRSLQSKTLQGETAFSVSLEHRRSRTFLSGQPFSFSRGDVNGQAQTTALRLGEEVLKRNQSRVFAARALLSVDSGFRGSTRGAGTSDDHFVIALGQAQYVKVLGDSGRQFLLRFNGQLASRPLLTVEQFSIGGADSVRGYRENQLVRDSGFTAAAEMRFPVATAKSGQNIFVLAPFADFGYGANRSSGAGADARTLSSVGVGAIYTPGRRLNAQIYYGYPLQNIASSGNNLQDKGIHFSLVFKVL